jgi:hypothetical protein
MQSGEWFQVVVEIEINGGEAATKRLRNRACAGLGYRLCTKGGGSAH